MEDWRTSNHNIEISIIIPSFNSKDTLFSCLDSIFSQDVDFSFEVIVIDSSAEDMNNMLSPYLHRIAYRHFDKRIYPGSARNIGASHAKGEILAFIDADCAAEKNWLKNIYHRFNNSKINVIGGSINNGYPSNLIATAEYLMEFGEFMPEKRSGFVQMAPSCNLAIKKDVFNQINGFSHFITGEDLLFSHLLVKNNISIYFDSEIRVTHYNRRILVKNNISIYFDSEIRVTHYNRRILKHFLAKQKELGMGSFMVRSISNVKGHQLAKYKPLSFFLPWVRIISIIYKVLKIQKKISANLITTFPFIILGILAYSFGFWSTVSYTPKVNAN